MYIKDTQTNTFINWDNYDFLRVEKSSYLTHFKLVAGKCAMTGVRNTNFSSKGSSVESGFITIIRESSSEEEIIRLYNKIVEAAEKEYVFVEI